MLYEHSDFAESAVVGVAHPDLGEDVGAAVALKPGAVATAEELRDFVKGTSCRLHTPAQFHIVDALSKVPPGKSSRGPPGESSSTRSP
ncbi:hypothetical protein ACFVKB_37300 [Rhodococcus sp. NPDC127530]|uniref:AMP-binding enzyme n=1 Tax=unclassified Rhodococcus (in: high G+C Gram-positive bacteria) TaxID=192944 RepID=UPI003633B003